MRLMSFLGVIVCGQSCKTGQRHFTAACILIEETKTGDALLQKMFNSIEHGMLQEVIYFKRNILNLGP